MNDKLLKKKKKYAEENKLIYFKTSTKTKQGINEGFSYIVNQAYKRAEQKLNEKRNIIVENNKRKTTKFKCSSSK